MKKKKTYFMLKLDGQRLDFLVIANLSYNRNTSTDQIKQLDAQVLKENDDFVLNTSQSKYLNQ